MHVNTAKRYIAAFLRYNWNRLCKDPLQPAFIVNN